MAGHDRRRDLRLDVIVAGTLSLAAFARAVTFGFVYDDRWTIVQNRWLDERLGALFSAMASGVAAARAVPDATRPAMVASLWVDRHLLGGSAVAHHVHSLLLYAGVAAAAAALLHQLLEDRVERRFAAAFFALAPLHAEVVCAANYREDLIASLGVLLPLAWLFRRSEEPDAPLPALAAAAVFGWGLLGKESAIVAVALVPAIALVTGRGRSWLRARELGLHLLASSLVLWLCWRFALTTGDDGIPRAAPTGWLVRLADTARYEVRALGAALFPFRPSPEWAEEPHAALAWLAALPALVLAPALAARSERTRTGALGLVLALIPPLGASPLVGPVNAWTDRYLFLAVLGGGVLHGVLFSHLVRRLPRAAWVAAASVAGLAAMLACFHAAGTWRDERAVWTEAVARAPASPRAWAALARVERLAGNLDEADRLVARALALAPGHVPSRITRIYILLARGDVEAARRELASLEAQGAGDHPGLSRARACSQKPPEQAPRCVASGG